MFDQLMDLLDREKRTGEKKRGGLRGFLQQLAARGPTPTRKRGPRTNDGGIGMGTIGTTISPRLVAVTVTHSISTSVVRAESNQ